MQEAGPFMQSFASVFQGMASANASRGAADMDDENARLSTLQGALNTADIRRRGRAVQGEAVAALAEGGSEVSGGSAADLIYQNSVEIEYAAMNAKYSAANEARAYNFRARQERQQATAALIGGILGAGAAAVNGVSAQRSAANANAGYAARQSAYFPGGQQLPMPPPPSYGGYAGPGGGP